MAGIAKFQHAWAIRLIQYQGRIASSCQPSARSARNYPAPGPAGRHPHHRQADQAGEEGAGVEGEQPAGPEDGDEHTAEGGPADEENALRQLEQAVGLLQLLGLHGLRNQRRSRRD